MKAATYFSVICFWCITACFANAQAPLFAFNVDRNVSPAVDSARSVSLQYRTRNNLIIVPVKINDTIKVNLILDSRCKSVVLFGKRYRKLLEATNKHKMLEHPNSASGHLSLNNKIAIGQALETNVPIVIMPNINILNFFTSVNGIIGYEFLSKFDVQIDAKSDIITLRPLHDKSVAMHFLPSYEDVY